MNLLKRLSLFLILWGVINLLVHLPVNSVLAEDIGVEIGATFADTLGGIMETRGGEDLNYVGCTRIDSPPVNAEFEQRVVELLNIERAKAGIAPLKRNSELDFAARYQARDMVEDDYFDHNTNDRVNDSLTYICSPVERVKLYYSGYSAFGENLAAGYDSPEQVIAGWMLSEGHRDNMLNPKYREIGIGFYEGISLFREYWGLDLGSKPNIYPVIINGESAITSSPSVSIYLYGKEVWGEVRLRNNTDAWSAWVPFQEKMSWQLPPVNGTHVLSVEMRRIGETAASAASSDSISLSGYISVEMPYRVFLPTIKR